MAIDYLYRANLKDMSNIQNRKEYYTRSNLIKRCTNPNDKDYHNYGGRGIMVCDSWIKSFSQFLQDVGNAPGKEYTIDRINNDGHYEPGNVRWITRKEQSKNRRNTILITYLGQTKRLQEWCDELGIRYGLVATRLIKLKWDPIKALTTPSDPVYNPRKNKLSN